MAAFFVNDVHSRGRAEIEHRERQRIFVHRSDRADYPVGTEGLGVVYRDLQTGVEIVPHDERHLAREQLDGICECICQLRHDGRDDAALDVAARDLVQMQHGAQPDGILRARSVFVRGQPALIHTLRSIAHSNHYIRVADVECQNHLCSTLSFFSQYNPSFV